MRRIRDSILLKVFLLLLYIGFYVGNTAFVHTHFYASYSVSHSHPYEKDSEGAPKHTHDKATLDTIAQFNSFSAILFLFLSIGIVRILLSTLIWQNCVTVVLRVVRKYQLRAPPALSF